MLRRALVVLLVIANTGCTVRRSAQVIPPDLPVPGRETITGITTVKGEMYTFDDPGASIVGNTLQARIQSTPFEIPVDQIQRFWVERKEISRGRSIALVTVTAAAVGLIAWAITAHEGEPKPRNTSCPFIYAWDGSGYVLDGEPYGGAITKGLERDDYSELAHLRVDHGSYRILVTNESDETQFTNLMALQVVDHPVNTRVVADALGGYHTVGALQPPISATDQSGHDLLRWLDADDRRIWEPPAAMDSNGSVRTPINLAFPKPDAIKTVELVANVATGTWGAAMMRESLVVRGRDLDAWYRLIDNSLKDRAELLAWNLREELYELKVYLKEPTGWELRGVIPGGGPVVAQDRVLALDVTRVPGDRLEIQIRPPGGFWALNYFAVQYKQEAEPHVQTFKASKAEDESGRNILAEISDVDDSYYTMLEAGNRAYVTFPAPPPPPAGMSRTVFLRSRGYYRIHLTPQGEPDLVTLRQVAEVPDFAARLAALRFRQWRGAQ